MATNPSRLPNLWHGVRMRAVMAAPEPDAACRQVTLPAAWPASAATALAALLPGNGPVSLAVAAQGWLGGCAPELARRLQPRLLARRCAPGAAAWLGVSDLAPGAILNLAAFHEPGFGYDQAALHEAVDDAVAMIAALANGRAGARTCLGLSGLAGAIAAGGLDYDSDAARALAVEIIGAARVRLHAAAAGAPALLVVAAPGPVDALLGIETGGIVPAFSPLAAEGGLSQASRALLAARGLSAEAALAAALAGQAPFPMAGVAAHAAMHAAVSPLLDAMPALPHPLPTAVTPSSSRPLPARRGGYAQKVGIGGHRLFLQTGEYDDGSLGELAITLPKETPAVRALADCLAQAVSIGLQHGVPLAAFVEALSGTRFAPAGAVDGDDLVASASSPVDYVFRKLAATYLPEMRLPAVEGDAPPPPLLPLDLPQEPALQPRRRLRVVR